MDNQIFQLNSFVAGYWRIPALHNGLAMTVAGGVAAIEDGAQIVQYTASDNPNLQFQIEHHEGGWHQIIARSSGKAWSVSDGGSSNGETVVQLPFDQGDNQLFYLEEV